VHSCGAWCQGPLLLQALNLVEGFDLAALGHNSPAYIHAVTEAIKLAAADREAWYGDPKFIDVPLDILLSAAYAADRRGMIRPDRAWPEMPKPERFTDATVRPRSHRRPRIASRCRAI